MESKLKPSFNFIKSIKIPMAQKREHDEILRLETLAQIELERQEQLRLENEKKHLAMMFEAKRQRRIENDKKLDKIIAVLEAEEQPSNSEIVITDELIEQFEPILNQIPVEIAKAVVDKIIGLENTEKQTAPNYSTINPDRTEIFEHPEEFPPITKTQKNILVLRNNMPKIEKAYTNIREFIQENEDFFKKSIITDKPIPDINRYILYDNPINNPLGLVDIVKTWDFTPYNEYKLKAIEKHRLRVADLKINKLKAGHITIITCIRNHLEYLKDSIGSLIEQKGPGANYWYNLIINDGSNEDIDLAKIFGDDFSKIEPYLDRITIINNKDWKGIVSCQIQAMDMVETEYVGILDGDDRLEPDCITKVLEKYNEYAGQDVFVYTNFHMTDRNFVRTTPGFCKEPDYGLLYDGFALAFRTWRYRDYLKTVGYNPKFRYGGEDVDILYKLEAVAKPVFISEYLYLYRRFNDIDPTAKKPKQHLSLSKYHRYNCKVAKIVNAIERFGNVAHIKIFGRTDPAEMEGEELERYREIFPKLKRLKKPMRFMGQEYYVELFIGHNMEYPCGLLKLGTYNDMNVRWFLNDYRMNGNYKHRVYIQWSHIFECLCVSLKPVDFDFNHMLDLHINYLYDEIYVSYNDNILNIDLNKLSESELVKYGKYIQKHCSDETDGNFFFHAQTLEINCKRYYNVRDLV